MFCKNKMALHIENTEERDLGLTGEEMAGLSMNVPLEFDVPDTVDAESLSVAKRMPPKQNYAVVGFIDQQKLVIDKTEMYDPKFYQKPQFALQFCGAYKTAKAAEDAAVEFRRITKIIDYYTVEMGEIVMFPFPYENDPLFPKNYTHPLLNRIIKGQVEAIKRARMNMKERIDSEVKNFQKDYGAPDSEVSEKRGKVFEKLVPE